ncbi:MAG: hypothetical protein AAGU75_23920, partial [Bacillota bacterium]
IVIEGVQTSFSSKYVPCLFTFSVTFGLEDFPDGFKENHKAMLEILDDEGKVVAKVDTFPLRMPTDHLAAMKNMPEEKKGIIMSIGVRNADFAKEGEYKTVLYVDENKTGEFPFFFHKL